MHRAADPRRSYADVRRYRRHVSAVIAWRSTVILFKGVGSMYPGRGTQPEVVELPVYEPEAVTASIGKPGEEDLFKFTVRHAGRHIVETAGETDLVMKLFGPNDQTRLVAEDDDSGIGCNPRIKASLLPGEYLVQVRHYNQVQGTGTYGIKVYR